MSFLKLKFAVKKTILSTSESRESICLLELHENILINLVKTWHLSHAPLYQVA
jgi:hypothetical protein